LKVKGAAKLLAEQLEIDPEVAESIVKGGLLTLEAVATQADGNDLADMLNVAPEEGAALHQKAEEKFRALGAIR